MTKQTALDLVSQTLIKFLAIGLGFFVNRLINTHLDTEALNTYNLITAYTPIILGLVTFGLPDLIQKFYTNHRDPELLKDFWTTTSIIRFVSYFLGIGLIFLNFWLADLPLIENSLLAPILIVFKTKDNLKQENLFYILGIFSAQFLLIADLGYRSVCNTRDRAWQFNFTDLLGKFLVVLFLALISLLFELTLDTLILILLFAYSICFFLDFVWQKDLTEWGKWNYAIFQANLPSILYLSISSFITSLYWTTDRLFLKQFGATSYQINGYTNIYRVFEIATVPGSLIVPILATKLKMFLDDKRRDRHDNTNNLPTLIWSRLGLVLSLGLFVAVLFWLFAPWILSLIEPKKLYFENSIQALPALTVALVFYFGNVFLSHLLIYANGEKQHLYATLAVALLAFYLYFSLIPKFLILGASWATALFYIFDFVLKTFLVFSLYKDKQKTLSAKKFVTQRYF